MTLYETEYPFFLGTNWKNRKKMLFVTLFYETLITNVVYHTDIFFVQNKDILSTVWSFSHLSILYNISFSLVFPIFLMEFMLCTLTWICLQTVKAHASIQQTFCPCTSSLIINSQEGIFLLLSKICRHFWHPSNYFHVLTRMKQIIENKKMLKKFIF